MRLSSLALVAVAVTALSGVARADQKMAYVDLQRALLEVEEGKAAKASLKAEFDKKQKTLDAEQEELKKAKETLDRQSSAMTEDARQAKQQELMGNLQKVQQDYMKMQQELSEKERTLTQGIFQKMEGIIAEIAQAEGLTFVFDKSAGLVYAPPALDLTNDLIRRYNDKYGGGAKGAGKAKQGAAKSSN